MKNSIIVLYDWAELTRFIYNMCTLSENKKLIYMSFINSRWRTFWPISQQRKI